MTAFDELRAILLPPNDADPVGSPDEWEEVEARHGMQFPSDYKMFLKTYGLGTPNGDFSVLSPFDDSFPSEQIRFRQVYREFYGTPDYLEYIAEGLSAPVPAGLVAWANGDSATAYWDTKAGDPDQWTVVEEREDYWQQFPLSMSDFLARVITGRIRSIVYGPLPHRLPVRYRRFSGQI